MTNHTVRLSEQEPAVGKLRLFDGEFGDINWKYKQFIEKEEFETAWNRT